MSGIEEVIEHLVAANIASGEALAGLEQAKAQLQQAHGRMQDSFNHVAAAMGTSNSETLRTVLAAIDNGKRDIESAIAAASQMPNYVGIAQEKATEYVERLQF